MLSESQNIEYKESWRDEYLKWICSFANANGECIYIGVNDKKKVIEKLFAEHASQPRNHNIANAFYKAEFIETWGCGINKIRQGLKNVGFSEPKIENQSCGTLMSIFRNVGINDTNGTNNVGD